MSLCDFGDRDQVRAQLVAEPVDRRPQLDVGWRAELRRRAFCLGVEVAQAEQDGRTALHIRDRLGDVLAELEPMEGLPSGRDRCGCGHERRRHADSASGDSRCLVVTQRPELAHAFDDGREGYAAYCACLRFTPAAHLAFDVEAAESQRRPGL
ncbi:MAG: hypothetical protein ABSG43_01035 [Solirubrobacteraceae bacterium]|jgi:hypothetical protein